MSPVPAVLSLKNNYPTEAKEKLLTNMGFEGKEAADALTLWGNTCAIRLSYCLLRCGVDLGVEPGRGRETTIRSGPAKGKHFWMSQKNLSNRLFKVLGKPAYQGREKEKLVESIGNQGGVISFMDLGETWYHDRYEGGHIDVVYFTKGFLWDSYSVKIDEVHSWDFVGQIMGFGARCSRAAEIRFWRSIG